MTDRARVSGHPIRRAALLFFALPAFVGLSALSVGACGGGGYGLCDRACDCEGCSDSVLESCYNAVEDAALDADQEGCGAEYDEFIACAHDAFECVNDRVEYGNSCFGEAAELTECVLN